MATMDDVRRIALALPETVTGVERPTFSVLNNGKRKGIAWVWLERVHPKKARVPNPEVLAVRVSGEAEKEMLLAAGPVKFFTEPHYNGFPAVLVRLAEIDVDELQELITNAWSYQAPPALVQGYETKTGQRRSNDTVT